MNTSLNWTQLIRSTIGASFDLVWLTLGLRAFALKNIPLVFLVKPTVLKLNEDECEIKLPLNFLTKNHLNSMYIGVLATGADIVGGLLSMHHIRKSSHKIQLVFKDLRANFIRRPESDVHFICKDGALIKKQIQTAIKRRQRINQELNIIAITPKISKNKPVAEFQLTLSLKAK